MHARDRGLKDKCSFKEREMVWVDEGWVEKRDRRYVGRWSRVEVLGGEKGADCSQTRFPSDDASPSSTLPAAATSTDPKESMCRRSVIPHFHSSFYLLSYTNNTCNCYEC